jgi:hypothetical protein
MNKKINISLCNTKTPTYGLKCGDGVFVGEEVLTLDLVPGHTCHPEPEDVEADVRWLGDVDFAEKYK